MFKTIYLTGAPASGKTTVVDLLVQSGKPIDVWSYSDRLKAHLAERHPEVTHNQMREQSSSLITREDIAAMDQKLLSFVEERRGRINVVIDSHPATKESYGFRVTAFTVAQLEALAPDEIWMTFAGAADTLARIAADPRGRPVVTEEGAAMHTGIQASVATTYGILTGRPIYFFDTTTGTDVTAKMISRLG